MAVYEHLYKPYAGPLTPEWSRFLIIPRHAYRDVFKSKLFTGFFALCFVFPLVLAIFVYLKQNAAALAVFNIKPGDVAPVNAALFQFFTAFQSGLGFLLTVLIGPVLISRDLANNALPLYLCRPLSRAEYVIGKMSVLMILISAITWVPGLLLFAFEAYLEGGSWLASNYWIAGSIFAVSWVWIILLSLLSVTMSAWVKWRMAASAGLFGLFIISNVMGLTINGVLRTRWGSLINLTVVMKTIEDSLFRRSNTMDLPQWMVLPTGAAWITFGLFLAFCLFLLTRKVRAYEVVR
jgi:ABC-type transport system involved in multi-copper enzyme maturation permease subunit